MIELPLVLLAGLLGSSHCVGMCGGFALALGSGTSSWSVNLRRQAEYTAGRVFTYGFLGALAGYGGWRLAALAPWGVNLTACLAIVAGLVLMVQGLVATGWLRRRSVAGTSGACPGPTLFATLLNLPGRWRAFLAGIFTGFLPCGLLYGMLALAAASHHWQSGLVLMAVFGLGTAPAMIATGLGGSLLSFAAGRRLWTVAAWCMVLTGALSTVRGAVALTAPADRSDQSCPWCQVPWAETHG